VNVLVVGTGSVGRRHISNLLYLGVDVAAFSYRAADGNLAIFPAGVKQVDDLEQALNHNFDGIVIANSTDLHMDVALDAARNGRNLFIEKPLSASLAGCEELLALTRSYGAVVEIGFMLRLHPNLIWIRQYLRSGLLGEVMHIRASVGQWLPDWRPGSDYRKGYGAFRNTGGGAIFDLIHELDVVSWLAGAVRDVTAMTRHVDKLGIETEAIAQIGLRLESGVLAQVHLDYVRPVYGRSMEIVGAQGVLYWDYTAGAVSLTRSDGVTSVVHQVPSDFERNAMFRDHMLHFLNRISDSEIQPAASLDDGVNILRVAIASHKSAEERRCVRPDEISLCPA
jgi:predicted dehydrogenase